MDRISGFGPEDGSSILSGLVVVCLFNCREKGEGVVTWITRIFLR